MPRTRKTQSGKPAMAVTPVTGQTYGAQVPQRALQQQMPAPRAETPAAAPALSTQAASAAVQPASEPMPRSAPADPIAAAAALRNRVGLFGPETSRPTEPLTAGLSTGPGPGPNVLGMSRRSPLGETMRMIAQQSGNPILARLADQAGL